MHRHQWCDGARRFTLDGTHTDTLALVLTMIGVLLATIASALIVKGYSEQTSKFMNKDTNVVSVTKKRLI